ncbi:MAG: DNA-binding protein [Desulfuromonadales bacterium]|nr:DNA-binding protein [Desulfuromonadales bacterium]
MSQRPILLDSNAYFRLAQSIRPLLNTPFGEKNYCLYILKELQTEYAKSSRLKLKFPWVNEPEYADNRTKKLSLTKKEKDEIQRGYDFILDFVRHVHPGVSKVDVLCLAHAEQLGIPVVTDDAEMREAAGNYGIKTLKTLELLKLMLDCEYIDLSKIRGIAAYLIYQNDTPKDFRKDFKKIFGEDAPR